MQFRRRKRMARLRDHSLSSEKRLADRYPARYPKMYEISPGVVACLADEDDEFSRWLCSQPRTRGREAAII